MKIMLPLAEGFEEIEALTVLDILKRAGIEVETVGVVGSSITGDHGLRVTTNKRLSEINADDYDGIVLPGGSGYSVLLRTSQLMKILQKLNSRNKLIAAICAAPSVLAKAGVLEGRKATIYPGMEREIPYPRDERVVVDGNIVTSQGPGTAMEFALKIVELLVGEEKVSKLKRQLVI